MGFDLLTMAQLTWREDWEIGLQESNDLFVDYRGGCTVCKRTHKFTHTEAVRS